MRGRLPAVQRRGADDRRARRPGEAVREEPEGVVEALARVLAEGQRVRLDARGVELVAGGGGQAGRDSHEHAQRARRRAQQGDQGVAEAELSEEHRESAEDGQGVRGGVQEGAEAVEQEVHAGGEVQERVPRGVQVVPDGQGAAGERAERRGAQRRAEEEARGQDGQVQEGGGDHQEQVQAGARRPQRLQLALHRGHERGLQEVRPVREGATRVLHTALRQAPRPPQHIRQGERRGRLRRLLAHRQAGQPRQGPGLVVQGVRLGHAHELARLRGVLRGAQEHRQRQHQARQAAAQGLGRRRHGQQRQRRHHDLHQEGQQ